MSDDKNVAGDKDLKKILDDIINQAELEISEFDTILINNSIVPSPALPERPETKLEDIPVGVKFSDQEIAAMVGADTSLSLVACSQIMGKATREDIGALFAKYHVTKAAIGLRILNVSKEKGWLVPPPLQIKRPELVEVKGDLIFLVTHNIHEYTIIPNGIISSGVSIS